MRLPAATVLLAFAAGCDCGGKTMSVSPVISVNPTTLDFGVAKIGKTASVKLSVSAASNTALHLGALSVDSDPAFGFTGAPETLGAFGDATLQVTLSPTEVRAYHADLVIPSDDEDHPEVRVALSGEGATAGIEVTPRCTPPCAATVESAAIHFAPEPAERAVEPPVAMWPTVRLTSTGRVPLDVTRLDFAGPDAAAFSTAGFLSGSIEPGQAIEVPVKIDTVAGQLAYQAELVVHSDDPARPEVRIALTGELRANLPPSVCANVTRVRPGDGTAPLDYGADWSAAFDGGYDFTQSREVQPNSVVELSAWSSSDARTCTTDPEDERVGLTYAWAVVSAPPGSVAALTGATTANPRFVPVATGTYVLRLTVADVQGHSSSADLRLRVATRQDLVAQLSWTGAPGVDLDVHLVRPGSLRFGFFDEGDAGRTSGDLNGWAQLSRTADSGFDFEWGEPGPADDPRLNLDDTGAGALLENVSLNYPEHAAPCAGDACTYQVLVHYFRDARDAGAVSSCSVSGCRDGERCDCAAGLRCVADLAPAADAGAGSGTCRAAVQPTVRVFVRADPVAAAVVPLDTLLPADAFALGAPCALWHVADVVWPMRGSDAGVRVEVPGRDDAGYLSAAAVERWGYRPNASGQCVPNTARGGKPWFSPVP
ncbi:MAG: choice-of-anchor D domain-containing protein [Archangiaceae bacterium]|nr:choice-of-anchor D domain-containing protein [Archangiaceae bacterium]